MVVIMSGGGMWSCRLERRFVVGNLRDDRIEGGIAGGMLGKGLGMGTSITLHEEVSRTGMVVGASGDGVGIASNV